MLCTLAEKVILVTEIDKLGLTALLDLETCEIRVSDGHHVQTLQTNGFGVEAIPFFRA